MTEDIKKGFSISRRRFLIGGITGFLVSMPLGYSLHSLLSRPLNETELEEMIIAASPITTDSIKKFTNRFTIPPIPAPELIRKISANWPNDGHLSVRKVRALLRAQIKDEFSKGRIAELHGWLFSETEVDLLTLKTLRTS